METEWYLTPINLDHADDLIIRRLTGTPENLQGRGIDLTITDHGEPVDMSGQSVYLAWRHLGYDAEGSVECEEVDASQGHFRVYYPQAMQHTGEIAARFLIWVKDGLILDSRVFRVNVEINVIKDDLALRDTDFSMFVQAIERLHIAEDKTENLAQSVKEAEEKREAAEKERQSQEETRQSQEGTRQSQEETRQEQEASRVAVEQRRVQAESERKSAEDARKSAEEARDTAEQKRQSKEQERIAAEDLRDEAETERDEAEEARKAAELLRKEAEDTRQSAENGRVEAEEQRNEYYKQIQQDVADGAFNGVTFTPYWTEAEIKEGEEEPVKSVLNFSNPKELPNPEPVDLRGPMGPQGPSGFTHDLSGLFWMGVETAGEHEGWLFVATAPGDVPPNFEYEDETGDLYVTW